jgi:hypothetical protein
MRGQAQSVIKTGVAPRRSDVEQIGYCLAARRRGWAQRSHAANEIQFQRWTAKQQFVIQTRRCAPTLTAGGHECVNPLRRRASVDGLRLLLQRPRVLLFPLRGAEQRLLARLVRLLGGDHSVDGRAAVLELGEERLLLGQRLALKE